MLTASREDGGVCASGGVLLFGGFYENQYPDDTWSWGT